MLEQHQTTEFTVRRSVWTEDEDDNKYSEEQVFGTFFGYIQQTQETLVQNMGLSLTNAFKVLAPIGTDVLSGDTIESNEGLYSVKAIKKVEMGLNPHLVLLVQSDGVRGS